MTTKSVSTSDTPNTPDTPDTPDNLDTPDISTAAICPSPGQNWKHVNTGRIYFIQSYAILQSKI